MVRPLTVIAAVRVKPAAVMTLMVVVAAVSVRPTAVMAPSDGSPTDCNCHNARKAYGCDGSGGGKRCSARKAYGGDGSTSDDRPLVVVAAVRVSGDGCRSARKA